MSSESEIENDFANASTSGASDTFPMQCSALRKNGFVMLKNRPCKIVDMSTSKTGKHGHAKVNIVGIDIFNSKKYEDMSPSTHNMSVPVIKREEFTLVDIAEDGFMSLMDENGNLKNDVKLPEGELGQQIKDEFDNGKELVACVLNACGEEACISFKEAPKS